VRQKGLRQLGAQPIAHPTEGWLLSTFCTVAEMIHAEGATSSRIADKIQMFSEYRCWYATCPTRLPTRVGDALIASNQMATTPYLDCLGCGVVLYGSRVTAPKTLCADCRTVAEIARGTHCRQCGSTTVLCCTEPDGFQTLFCTACDHVWCSARSSAALHAAARPSNCLSWPGVERRQPLNHTADAIIEELLKAG
jgi:hypothetical protein